MVAGVFLHWSGRPLLWRCAVPSPCQPAQNTLKVTVGFDQLIDFNVIAPNVSQALQR